MQDELHGKKITEQIHGPTLFSNKGCYSRTSKSFG